MNSLPTKTKQRAKAQAGDTGPTSTHSQLSSIPADPTQRAECTHCRLPVPRGMLSPEREEQFCCHGCRAAWQLIHSAGLGDFYKFAETPSTISKLDQPAEEDALDDPAFQRKFVRQVPADQPGTTPLPERVIHSRFALRSLCLVVGKAAAAVAGNRRMPGQLVPPADLPESGRRTRFALSDIARTARNLGYQLAPIQLSSAKRNDARQQENHAWWVRIGFAAVAAGNNMLIAAALYLGMFSHMTAEMLGLLRWASCLVGLFSVIVPGRIFLRGAYLALKTRTPHMDLPIAMALVIGSFAGLANTIRGVGDVYFDSLSVLVLLLLLGRWVQFRQQGRAADAVELLHTLTPARARKLDSSGQTHDIPLDEVEVGDQLEVRAGELVPVDGCIAQGQSNINQALLTGESKPVFVNAGSDVLGGSENMDGWFIMTAQAVGRETRISRVMQLVEQASAQRPQIVEWANRMGAVFTVTVIGLAAVAAVIGWHDAPGIAVDRAVSILIIACPCALALATPLAIANALGRLARQKILVKSGDVIQQLDQPGTLWLDKTGTLTTGKMQVRQWFGDTTILPLIARIESRFQHPIALALTEYAAKDCDRDPSARPDANGQLASHELHVRSVWGGVEAELAGKKILVGNRQLLENHLQSIPTSWLEREHQLLASDELSPIWVAVDGQVIGLAGLGDEIREDAKTLVANLRGAGWQVGILSGDAQRVVDRVARRTGVPAALAMGDQSPEQKLQVVQQAPALRSQGTTVMVGDGVNDSAALAAAGVGIAVSGSAEASLSAASVYLNRNGIGSILELLQRCQSANRVIRWNLGISIAFNLVGVVLAMSGWLNPLVAAVLMPISSLTVLSISSRAGNLQGGLPTTARATQHAKPPDTAQLLACE